ncbi:MAG: hypothetical protein CSA97_03205 [Bacteroidetes bacterium]|nr:MAG: hypothetical protein CSA97_03205 [Bacteroidota bacterium]
MYRQRNLRILPLILLALVGLLRIGYAQEDPTAFKMADGILLPCWVENGDTIPYAYIPPVTVAAPRKFKSRRNYWAYQRKIRNLKKVYPYAKMARDTLRKMDSVYLTLKTRREQRRYVQKMNKQLRRQFEKQIRRLTYSQGRMFIKLIDRETGRSTFAIIKQFKGGFTASFFQGVARLFGEDLKARYDPTGADRILEELIQEYEMGRL